MNNKNCLIDDLRARLSHLPGLTEKKMMGGHCFLLNGHMLGGSGCNEAGDICYMIRVGKENATAAEQLNGWQPLIKGGRTMGGMYLVDPNQPSQEIDNWLTLAIRNASSLPPK
ncbi:MAG: TfoX/Sxy family protein [Gammaproteobacteria bacterium]|nr:TfoX/Sxy family protein [Gammaproteobacteria bacterium]